MREGSLAEAKTLPHLIRLNRQQSQYTEVVHFTSEGVHAPSLSILTQRPHLYHSWLPSLVMICSRDVPPFSIHKDPSLARGRAPKYPIAAWRVNSQIPVLIQAMLVLDPCELPARRHPPVRNVEEGMWRGIFKDPNRHWLGWATPSSPLAIKMTRWEDE